MDELLESINNVIGDAMEEYREYRTANPEESEEIQTRIDVLERLRDIRCQIERVAMEYPSTK